MNQMKKCFWIILIILFSLPFSVSALPWEDDTMQSLCDGSSATSSIIYTLKDGTRRYLFCNNAFDDIGENTIDICNDDGKLSRGDSICLNRGQKTITLKNFDGEQLYIGDIDFDGNGEYEDIKIVYEGTNVFNTQNDDPYTAAIFSSSPLTIEGKDSSSSLTINVNKRNSSSIYKDGISVSGGDLNFNNCSNLNVNVNSTCLSSGFVFSGIKIDDANLIIENSNITVNVNDIGETCSSETRPIGVGINAIDSGVVIGQDESDTTVTINTELEAIYMHNTTSSIKDFIIKEQVTSSEINNNEHLSQSNRDTKLLINYNSTNKKNNLLNFYNASLNVKGWMEIVGDLKAVDSDPLFSAVYDTPVYFYNSKLDVWKDGAFIISASSPNSILSMENSIIETDGNLHIKNIDSAHSSIKLLGNDSNVIIGESACSLENLNIKDNVYLDPEIKWTYGNKLISNKNTSRPVYINSKKALHHGWLATSSIADSNVTLSGIASINILDKGIAKLTKDSTLEASNIFALPTKDNAYQVLTRISSSLVSNDDELKLYLAKLDGNNYVQVGETLTTKAGTLKLGTMSDFVYNKDDMEDYSDLINSNDMYYSFELTAEQLSSGIYYILETTETKTYFEDESSAKTGIRLYPPKALSSKYKFFATSNLNNDIESKIESEIYNLGFPSIDIKKINYYEFSFSADNIVAPDGVYKIKLPTHGDYGSEAQIYAFNSSGSKLDRKIAATIEDNYYVFEINKSDLDNTIFALIDFPEINSLKDSTGKYILTAGHNRIYSGCKFIVNIGSQSVSGNVTQDNKSFELRCGDNYTLPDIVYSIIIPKPNGTSPKLYDGVNISTAKEVSLTPKTEDKLSFDVSNTDIDKTPTTYALTYTNACSTVTQTKYKIKFNTDGGNTISEETVTIGSAGKTLPTPTKTGYTFDYWQYSDGTKVTATKTTEVLRDADKIIEKDSNGCSTEYYKTIELKAVWKQNSGCNDAEMNFKVIYNVDGGNPISEETVTSSTTKNIPIPTKNDHKFLGWYSDSAKTKKITATKLKDLASPRKDGSTCITGYNDVTLYASWEKITTYTVTFDTDGGTPVPASQTIEANGKVNKPTDPTKTGYAFKEWQLNNVTYDFSKVVTSNITLKAVWTENSNCKKVNKEFKLTYYGDSTSHTISESTTDKLPTEATTSKEGYSFKGWCYDEACTKPINSETLLKDLIVTPIKDSDDRCTTGYQDLTIYPKFEKNSVEPEEPGCSDADLIVSLVYNTNGGNELPQNNKALDIKFNELAIPVRSGYTFAGWYLDEELTTKLTEELWKKEQQERYEFVSKDPACRLALIALYANWTKNETEVVSVGGAKITHELIDDASKFNFVVDQLTENETAFVSGILENAKKTAAPKKVIDIYKFNLTGKEEGTVLPGGKYQIKLPITDLMNKYDQLEFAILDEKGNITDQYYSLTKDGDYYVITINYEDLGKTNFALIGNEIKQVSTGIPFKVGAFTILIAGFGYVSYKVKKKNKLFKI